MARPRMRPSFNLPVACSAEHLMQILEQRFQLAGADFEGKFSARHAVLALPASERRFWSPCLDLTIEDLEPAGPEPEAGRAKLWGTFSPRAEIWTGFVFAIGTLSVLSVFASMYGLAQLALGHAPVAFLVPLIAALVAALLYASALVGQGLSIADLYQLRAFIDDCAREAEATAASAPRTAVEGAQL